MQTFQDVLNAARTLPPAERLRLIEMLWEDVEPADWPAPSAEWIAKAQRRSDEYDRGATTATSWQEVRDQARRKAGLPV